MFFAHCFLCLQNNDLIKIKLRLYKTKLVVKIKEGRIIIRQKTEKIITSVETHSCAYHAGIEAGDILLALNGKEITDVFDYRTGIMEERIDLTIRKADGSTRTYTIEKEEYEDPGLEFENYLMDKERVCHNKCIFCFVDQLPLDARQSLHFKDDDIRLSFLNGNFVTLTNVSDEELERIVGLRLSPLNISVHTTNPDLRVAMLKNPKSGKIMDQLRYIVENGITINTQLVLCPGINDGEELDRSLRDLATLGDRLESIAVVPVGLTKFTKSLSGQVHVEGKPLRPYTRDDAVDAIERLEVHQARALAEQGRRLVFAADELYIKAGRSLPKAEEYEDFYQLENGIGLMPLFLNDLDGELKSLRRRLASKKFWRKLSSSKVVVITGVDAAPYLERYEKVLSRIYGRDFHVRGVKNTYFGESVTVAGLVTGGDIIKEADSILASGLDVSEGLASHGEKLSVFASSQGVSGGGLADYGKRAYASGLDDTTNSAGEIRESSGKAQGSKEKGRLQISEKEQDYTFLVPDIMLRDLKDAFLDDLTVEDFAELMPCEFTFVPSEAKSFLEKLDELFLGNRLKKEGI